MPRNEPTRDEVRHHWSREYFEALIIALVFLLFTNTFIVKTFYIPSGSMEDTLLIGDHLFVNRFIYGPAETSLERFLAPSRDIRRGDIVIFRSPESPVTDLVKRCVGLPGDTIEIVDKVLHINGSEVVDDTYASRRDQFTYGKNPVGGRTRSFSSRDNFGPFKVPEDSYFCMGDNRDQSHDSRFWGPVPRHLVKGRAFIIYWSYAGETSDGQWVGWRSKLLQTAKTVGGFFTKTRWSRTLHLIR